MVYLFHSAKHYSCFLSFFVNPSPIISNKLFITTGSYIQSLEQKNQLDKAIITPLPPANRFFIIGI
jgi:hypothetical protein